MTAWARPARLVYFEQWVHPIAGEMLAENPNIQVLHINPRDEPARIEAALAEADGCQSLTRTDATLSGTGERWLGNAQFIALCPKMLAIFTAGAGYDVIDVEACTRAGVLVCNQSGVALEAVAEHSLGFMLALSKKISIADRVIRRTPDWSRVDFTGNDLLGKTLGIVGFGHIARRLVELVQPLRMKVLACDPFLTAEQIAESGAKKAELMDLLRVSDFVSANAPLTDQTRGMFGRAQFAAMKPGAFFLTTARGGVHDEDALVEALASGHLGGAGVDVFLKEPPPPDHPLFRFDNVVATPHSAGVTFETTRDIAVATAKLWTTLFAGEAPSRVINPEAWPHFADRFTTRFGFRPAEPC